MHSWLGWGTLLVGMGDRGGMGAGVFDDPPSKDGWRIESFYPN